MTEGKKKILICEDEAPLARALGLKLSSEGFDVVAATGGQEAIQKIGQDKYDLILLDIVMPEVDGFAVLAKLKETGSTTPVIVISNLGQTEDMDRAKSLGVKDYIIKSNASLADIVARVKKALL